MPRETKPAEGVVGGDRKIKISDWKPHQKNSLQGYFTATLPSGMVISDLMLHERDGSRWIAFPGREWADSAGTKRFVNFIRFTDRDIAHKFRDQVLAALDKHREGLR
jgi:hypothetical protein